MSALLPVQVLCAPLTPVAMVAPLPVVMVTLLALTLLPSLCRGGGMLSSPPPTLPLLLPLRLQRDLLQRCRLQPHLLQQQCCLSLLCLLQRRTLQRRTL